MITVKSRKAKARACQDHTAEVFRGVFNCAADDIRPAIMGESGADLKISPTLKARFPYVIECKNQEKLNIWDALSQAESNAAKEGGIPMLVFHRNRSDYYAVVPLQHYAAMLAHAVNYGVL